MFDLFRSSRRGRRRPVLAVVTALALAVTITACDGPPAPENPPYWLPGSTVTATNHGPLVHIEWDAPAGGDPEAAYQINLGTYNGTGVALVPASVRECYITGLNPSTAYTIVVTARDAQMHWSGPLPGTQGNRTTTITTTSSGGSGTLWCHSGTDADSDGLPDALETDDGTYSSASDAGTDPTVADTDNDGISDGVETLGRPGLNLIAMGARPTHKDLLIETDWIAGAPCSTQATVTKLAPMVAAFAEPPEGKVTNPDGTQGIKVIVDYGQGGHFTGGTQIPDPDSTLDGRFTGQDVGGPSFVAAKATYFNPVRDDIFRYSIIHGGVLGRSTAVGADSYVNGCGTGPLDYPGTLMHEIGHNLGLLHGGGPSIPSNHPDGVDWLICEEPVDPVDPACTHKVNLNYKPNYVSIMNYEYDLVNDSCNPNSFAPKWLDYSDGSRATIDENAVDETIGICDGPDPDTLGDPFDFNSNGVIDPTPYRYNITSQVDTVYTPLHDHDDWTHIATTGLALIGPN